MTTPINLASLVESVQSSPWKSRRRLLLLIGLPLLLLLAYLLMSPAERNAGPGYQTEAASQGDLTVTVSASGTLAPTNEVEVGSELSGTVDRVLVDVNDRVKKGQLLARLDIAKLQDSVAKSEANLAAAEAQVAQARATVSESRANLARLRHVAELSGGKVPAQSELDTAEATLARAVAGEASARASVAQNQAALKSDRTNLAKASIVSPINGVVLTRQVEPGQTVAASLEAPVLFTLAEDLTRMELQVDVDEADVGQVKEGQEARFSVDAWPGRHYAARITRVSFGATSTDQVVSYQTTLQVDNADLSLRPGMTANAEIVTARVRDALLVPNAALRFTPPETAAAKPSGGLLSALLPRPPASPEKKAGTVKAEGTQRVWVLRDGQPVPVDFQAGLSDGSLTQVLGGELKAGMAVITDEVGVVK
ncbi:MAG: efflux RND transporter periplasmic adaptor subunit [Pseudomonadota bacterium]